MKLADICPIDIILDTNVLSHADNPASPNQVSALQVVSWMRDTSALWVLDDNGKSAPDPWTSVLYLEYQETLPPQGASITLFLACLQSGRIKFSPRPNHVDRKAIEKLVPRNKRDRAVLGAAHGSESKILVSNDLSDFSEKVRKSALKELGVSVLHSEDAAPIL
ncbi:hypothetical protein [Pseudoclavibacter helvolus]|uniref:hypothetical protein n=1 Tax=Pseudoclavibacter helvolus TaxID=255205 RepID=UPI0024ADA40B|nr:hypothetical protein [Pseudoclavibacter helvolus]